MDETLGGVNSIFDSVNLISMINCGSPLNVMALPKLHVCIQCHQLMRLSIRLKLPNPGFINPPISVFFIPEMAGTADSRQNQQTALMRPSFDCVGRGLALFGFRFIHESDVTVP